MINLLDKEATQPSNFRTKKWVEIIDDGRRMYSTNNQIRFETPMLKSNLCGYSDAYILAKGTITAVNTAAADANINTNVIFINCAPFTDCISEINNAQVDNAQNLDIVMPMYNLIEYSDNYAMRSGILYQCYRDEPALDNNGNIVNFKQANRQ